MELLIIFGILAVAMGGLGAWIASQKKREPTEGFLLGFLFGPIGCLIEALLADGNGRHPVEQFGIPPRRPDGQFGIPPSRRGSDPINEGLTSAAPLAPEEKTSRRISDSVVKTVPDELPKDRGKPSQRKPVREASEGGIDTSLLKDL